MKTLIFSDTHLTDTFDQAKYDFLRRIISQADKVIINGDFWDGFRCSFDDFLASDWQQLFPLLLEKQTVYLYGNHDGEEYCDERVSQFSVQQGLEYQIKLRDKVVHIEHGDRLDPLFGSHHHSQLWDPILKMYDFFDRINITYFRNLLRLLFFPKWLIYLIIKKHVSDFPENTILVVGHTHWPYFNLHRRFINLDAVAYGFGGYVTIDDGERLVWHRERYG